MRGGSRPGAGSKPRTVSEKEKKRILKSVTQMAKKEGKTPHEVFAEVLITGRFFNNPVEPKDWSTCYRIFLDAILVKSTHKKLDVEVKDNRVAVYLPEIRKPDVQEIPNA
jgi:hypothetical protein